MIAAFGQPPGGTPLKNTCCPLCGEPNACAVAHGGSFDTPCWCRDARISPDVLARLPSAQRGIACVCARCASPAAGDGSPQAQPGPAAMGSGGSLP